MSRIRVALSLVVPGALLLLGSLPVRAHEDPNPQRAPLVVTTTTNKTVYAPGEPVTLRLRVRNPLSRPVVLDFHTSQLHDFFVSDRFGAGEVWRWSHDKLFTQALTQRVLAPGETWVVDSTWNQTTNSGQPVPPGFYRVRGRVTSHPPYDGGAGFIWIRG
jgi:hypothetical protein